MCMWRTLGVSGHLVGVTLRGSRRLWKAWVSWWWHGGTCQPCIHSPGYLVKTGNRFPLSVYDRLFVKNFKNDKVHIIIQHYHDSSVSLSRDIMDIRKGQKPLVLHTDSQYSTEWINMWPKWSLTKYNPNKHGFIRATTNPIMCYLLHFEHQNLKTIKNLDSNILSARKTMT